MVGLEGGLPLVSFLYLGIVEAHQTSNFMKYLALQSFAISSRIRGSSDESLTSLAVYFHNWHMFREDMNNIPC